MNRLIAVAVTALALAVPGTALAHVGQVTHISCGELDAQVSKFPAGKSVVTAYVNYDGGAFSAVPNPNTIDGPGPVNISQGWRADDWAGHKVGVYFSWTADGGGRTQTAYNYVSNCGPFAAGTPGPPGTGYDCAGNPVAPGGTPATCPGSPGTSTETTITKTIIIRQAPKTCTSERNFSFRVRRSYAGSKIVQVHASEPSVKVNVSKRNGRFTVSFSTKGKKYNPGGGQVRTITVKTILANHRHVRMQWDYRPCMGPDGNLNDPSAAGQGTTGT